MQSLDKKQKEADGVYFVKKLQDNETTEGEGRDGGFSKVSIHWKSCYSVRESIVFRCKAMHPWAGRMVHLVKHVTCKHENKVLSPPQQEEYVLQALNPRSGESETAGSLVSAGQSGQGETLCQRSRRCSWGWHLRISSGIHTYACIPPT